MSTTDVLDRPITVNALADEFWEDNPNFRPVLVNPDEVEQCYHRRARQLHAYTATLPTRVRLEIIEYRSTVVTIAGPTTEEPKVKQPRRKKSLRDKLGWMLHVRQVKQGEIEPIPLKLSEIEHDRLMKYGVIPVNADERKLSREQRARVEAIRKGAAPGRTLTQLRRSYRRLGDVA